jgi:ribosomal protein S18 acetylase RimI-like enzyme
VSQDTDQTFEVPGYRLREGSVLDRAQLMKMMQRAYRDLGAMGGEHLADTVQRHFSSTSQLWWVDVDQPRPQGLPGIAKPDPVGCLWLGYGIDQWTGEKHTYVFLVYVAPDHRRQGLGTALMQQAKVWTQAQGYGQIGLQVFDTNQPALALYKKLGYQPRAVLLTLEF